MELREQKDFIAQIMVVADTHNCPEDGVERCWKYEYNCKQCRRDALIALLSSGEKAPLVAKLYANCAGCEADNCEKPICAIAAVLKAQRDADMLWHEADKAKAVAEAVRKERERAVAFYIKSVQGYKMMPEEFAAALEAVKE